MVSELLGGPVWKVLYDQRTSNSVLCSTESLQSFGKQLRFLVEFYRKNRKLCVSVALFAGYVSYYLLVIVRRPKLLCGQKRLRAWLLRKCPTLSRRFWLSPWCWGGVPQTVFAYYSKELLAEFHFKRELLALSDGGNASLDWLESEKSKNNNSHPTIVFLPGMNGDSQVNYLKTFIRIAHKLGYRCVVFNNRGRGGVKLTTPRTYSALDYKDLREAILRIKSRFPDSKLIAAGSSIGGVILGHYLVNMGEDTGLEAAVIYSAVYDFNDGFTNLENGPLKQRLNRFLARGLADSIRDNRDLFHANKNINMKKVLRSETVREFDTHFTSIVAGYKTVDEYYKAASLRHLMGQVRIPVLAINSEDDPFQPGTSLPSSQSFEGSPFALVVAPRGGHLAFLEGFHFWPSYSDHIFHEFCTAILESNVQDECQPPTVSRRSPIDRVERNSPPPCPKFSEVCPPPNADDTAPSL